MEAGCVGLLESVTQKTLHAQNFSRSSSQASHVLTDLLSRYLALVSATCARYAEHAGRTSVSVADALLALEEVGTSVDELSDYCDGEARELARYAGNTARRAEELAVLKESLAGGRRLDRDDAIALVYAPVPDQSDAASDADEEEESEKEEEERIGSLMSLDDVDGLKTGVRINGNIRKRPASPTLPPSPISNPSSPGRKRPRTAAWSAPSYIPDFLPPFPASSPPLSTPMQTESEQTILNSISQERQPTPPPQLSTSTSTSDYITPVPYSMSSLSTLSAQHLPELRETEEPPSKFTLPESLLKPAHAMTGAYLHVLRNKPPPQPVINPQRHKVALVLLQQMYNNPRWTAADTLFSNAAPPRPRVVAPAPSYPLPIKEGPLGGLDKEKDLRQPLPPVTRTVIADETLTPLSGQPVSRISEIARHVLPPSVYSRASRMYPPPPLAAPSQEKFLYGAGLPAPWNSSNPPASGGVALSKKVKELPNGKSNDENGENKADAIPDAMLFATWEWEQKDFRIPLGPGKKGRTSSLSAPHRPTISLQLKPTAIARDTETGSQSAKLKGRKGDAKSK